MRTAPPEPLDLLPAFERAGDGVYAVDYDQNIVYWNETAERLLGHKASDVLGRKCFDIIAGGDYLGHPFCGANCEVIECARRGRAPENYDVCTKKDTGERRWINVSIVTLTGRRRRSALAVHLFRDITEKRRRNLPGAVAKEVSGERPAALARLTRRETEVLQCLGTGMSTAQIAETLGLSAATVRNHVEHVLEKLGVHSKLEAVVMAAQHRVI